MGIKMYSKRIKKGHTKEIARLITLIEDNSPIVEKELEYLYDNTGNAHIVGITGAPGSGKSSLINQLTEKYRKDEEKVGIICVDPTSPYTGGSLLGDRIRMNSHFLDKGVFIRSMATRGHLGGLSNAVYNAVKVLDAAGYNPIFIETVGVGQAEVEIAEVADTSVVVLTRDCGDAIQIMKAGIMEIADIFVVNKFDKEGADNIVRNIKDMLSFIKEGRKPTIYKTIATNGSGVTELRKGIKNHLTYLKENELFEGRRKRRIRSEIIGLLHGGIEKLISQKLTTDVVEKIYRKEMNPYIFVRELLGKYKDL